MRNNIFFIDPQSMGNLAEYDYSVTHEINCNIIYLCSKYYDYNINKKIKYIPIFSYNHKKNFVLKSGSYACSLIKLVFYIIKYKPNLIHIQWFKIPSLDYLYWKVLKNILHIPIVHTAHNVLPHNTGNKYKEIYGKIYSQLLDKIIVHNEKTKIELINLFNLSKDKIIVIRHGLLNMKYNVEEYNKFLLDNPYNDAIKDKIVFTSLGEQSWYKGSDIIIDVWNSTPELNQSDKCCLVIAGKFDGIDFKKIESTKNVIIKNNRISNEEYMFWLKHTAAYLLPYRVISQSGALLTTLAAHIPIVVSNVGGLNEPLNVAEVGWNIGNANPENLRKTLLSILYAPHIIELIKNNIKSWNSIEDFYDWEQISKQTESLYYEMTNQ